MDASVLIVGNPQFLKTFLDQIRTITSGKVEESANPEEALSKVQAKQYAILIVQATQNGSLELCKQVKEQLQLSWTYCILINDPSYSLSEGKAADPRREQIICAEALEGGADAYLPLTCTPTGDPGSTLAEYRLLKAHILAGWRSVQFYQKLLQTNDVLSTLALADPLTELNNRRAMEWELPRQIQNARTYITDLSVIMMDVDHFKSVNDTYGHQVGDRVLQLLSTRLQHNLRLQDTLFRYGGEEFLVVLNQTNGEEAKIVAKRLRYQINEQPFNVDGTIAIEITISVGIASLKASDDHKGESLVKRADHNLLRAKAKGTNQVIYSDDTLY